MHISRYRLLLVPCSLKNKDITSHYYADGDEKFRCLRTDGADASPHHLAFGYFDGETQIRYPHVTVIVEENVLGLAVTIHDALLMQMLQAADDFGSIEASAHQLEAWIAAHVVDVELQIATCGVNGIRLRWVGNRRLTNEIVKL